MKSVEISVIVSFGGVDQEDALKTKVLNNTITKDYDDKTGLASEVNVRGEFWDKGLKLEGIIEP